VRTVQGYLRPVLFYFRLAANTAKVGLCSEWMRARTSRIAVGNLRRRTASLVLWTEFVADVGGMVLHGRFVLGFDDDARQRFRAPVTDDDAAGVLEAFFRCIDSSGDGGDGSEARFSRTLTLTMTCGKSFRSATNSSRDSPERTTRSSTPSAVSRLSPGEARLGPQDVTRCATLKWSQAALRAPRSSSWRLRWQQRRATIAFALRTARNIPDCFNREPIRFAHPSCLCYHFLKYGRCVSNAVEQKHT
jgi:hypothetical protein